MFRTIASLGVLFLCVQSASLSANIIQNGSFENGSGGSLAGWSVAGTAESREALWSTDGDHSLLLGYGDLFADAVVSQAFSTHPGVNYSLAFDLTANGVLANIFSLLVEVAGSSLLISETLTQTPPLSPHTPISLFFKADSTTATLTFSDISADPFRLDGLIDNVQVKQVHSPSTLPLLLAGLAFGWTTRRSTKWSKLGFFAPRQ
ncbi:MAG: DUF642 domain-containing protein [Chromatiaceae bacterium]|nr:DUF642 domain-containing protein [Chromatiaceae bacterium]MCF8004098.1 DUF642 domain-containing protein [Chromatiaceae bacterium]